MARTRPPDSPAAIAPGQQRQGAVLRLVCVFPALQVAARTKAAGPRASPQLMPLTSRAMPLVAADQLRPVHTVSSG